MKRYTLLDQNVPMVFYRFYIYFRMPVSIIMYLIGFAENGFSDIFSFALNTFEILLYVCACIGLWKMKHWGYVLNKIFLIYELAVFSVLIPVNVYFQDYAAIGTCVGQLVVNTLIFIYFEKRKFLFGTRSLKKTPDVEQQKKSEPVEEIRELLIDHTCINCGRSFKVRFKTYYDQTEIPALSVVCPFCDTTEILKQKKTT